MALGIPQNTLSKSPRQDTEWTNSNEGIISNSKLLCHKNKLEIIENKLRAIIVLLNAILCIIVTNQFTFTF